MWKKRFKEYLNSLINQTYNNIEIICINDGSVGNSLEILQEYKQKYPDKFVILTQENQGLSTARNTGINLMKGEFCLFLDSDDYISPIIIELCIKKMIYFESDGVYFKGIHFAENRILDYMYVLISKYQIS
ncbi:Glycosyl transferase family 2 [Brevinema andersonii]|uniref:Glycosyl transferase family 2 n=1 Tax=Brevinema andersonii TaxID=34097 RepID=A0A1I1EVA8_BREAD|nr:glycosyltransferase family 2 protein [Brevinema andersonii]SFB91075.1 Glycosyl transferase family 2 [Brevinema andersonii]